MLLKFQKQQTIKHQSNDRIEIHGIYIGHNFTTNRSIIQCIDPKKPEEFAKNQFIEVDEKYVKRIPKTSIQKPIINIPKSNISKPITSKTGKEITDITERNLVDEWDNIIGDNEAAAIAVDAAETCDSWTLNDCDCCKRVLFCLAYYRLWIIHKQELKNKKTHNNNKFYADYLVDFIEGLREYSSTAMLNDFHHIKQFHITNATQHNHSINNESKQDIFEFFKNKMGICNHTNCRSYSRNHRDRSECAEYEKIRRDMYFIDESQLKFKSDEITETNVQQLFDMIHCALLHPQSSTTGSGSSKFITEIKEDIQEQPAQEEKKTAVMNDNEEKKYGNENEKENESKQQAEKEAEKVQTAVLSSYGFGAQFKYHQEQTYKNQTQKNKNYIAAKWKNLKEEILKNALYTISEFDFDSIYNKSEQYLQSYRGKSLIARKQSKLNEICKIKPNTIITMDHIISLMLYTNMDDLQREFKKGCRYLASDTQADGTPDIEKVKRRNREIANWCKLLWESITFYGESITKKQVFYHGLSCKLLFDSVIAAFNCPTSTTVNKSVAFNFSSEKGIIVQLTKFASLDSHYLDVSDLSDYPNEQERLFFQAQLGFQDIIYQNTSNKYFIKCLSLFQNITKGNFFTHDSKIFKKKHQKTLIKMMDSVINSTENKKIPTYMQQLFEHYCVSIKQFGNIIWINKEEFSKLNENIRQYLTDEKLKDKSKDKIKNENNFLNWLKNQYRIKIRYPKTVSHVVKNYEEESKEKSFLSDFWAGKSVMLPSISYTVVTPGKKAHKINLKLKLKKGATANDGTAMIMCKISNAKLPSHIQKLKCDIGIFCPQINFSYTTAMTVSKQLQAIPLCESIKLEGLDAFEWKIFIKFRGKVDSRNYVQKF